jgi:hypothetical protein
MQGTNRKQEGDEPMFKMTILFKKIALAALALAIGLAALPLDGASAAGLKDATTPPINQTRSNQRLETLWAREQQIYQRQGNRLDKADEFIAKVQTLIDRANGKGWDTSAVQNALNAFAAVIPSAQAAHDNGAAIVANHAGFDADSKVVDRASAIETLKSLNQVLKGTRTAMNGTGEALREAIKAFRDSHRPASSPTS